MMPPAALIARSVLRSAARPGPAPRGLRSGPPQSPVSTAESAVGLGAVFAAFFVPAAWVLGRIHEYRKREEPEE